MHWLIDINNNIKASYDEEAARKEHLVCQNIKEDPTSFFRYAANMKKQKQKIGPLQKLEHGKITLVNRNKEMAQILSDQYKSVFTAPRQEDKIEDVTTFFSQGNENINLIKLYYF